MTLTGNTAFSTQKASYLQVTGDNMSSINNSKATEISGWNNIYSFDNYLIVTNIDGDNRISRYKANGNGSVTLDKTIVVSEATAGLSYLTFISKTLAAGLSYDFKVFFFNPSTMQLTGDKIDLTSLVDPAWNSSDPTEMIYRDGKIYIGIMYRNYFGPFSTTIKDECNIAVCDVAGKKLDKVITNTQTTPTGIHAKYNGSMLVDALGDIYVLGHKFYDSGQTSKNPTAILRIKKGETDFDPTYFFNTETATGKGVTGMQFAGGSKAFICVYYPDEVNPLDPYSGYNDPVFKYWTVDLPNKTTQEVTMPFHKGYTCNWMHVVSEGKVLAPIITKTESAVYEMNFDSRTVNKKFTTTGEPQGFYPLSAFTGTGIKESVVSSVSIYPNPAGNVLNVELSEQGSASIRIVNVLGQEMYAQQLNTNTRIDISSLPAGSYKVILSDEITSRSSSLIKL